jgi:thiamine kinase-like enzyme
MQSYGGTLPLLPGLLGGISSCLQQIERIGSLPEETQGLLCREFARLSSRLSAEVWGPVQPIHGDAHVGNLLATEKGWLWNDFEDVCLGPVAWDVACFDLHALSDEDYPDVSAGTVDFFRGWRALQAVTWVYALIDVFPDEEASAKRFLDEIQRGALEPGKKTGGRLRRRRRFSYRR